MVMDFLSSAISKCFASNPYTENASSSSHDLMPRDSKQWPRSGAGLPVRPKGDSLVKYSPGSRSVPAIGAFGSRYSNGSPSLYLRAVGPKTETPCAFSPAWALE